MGLRIFSCMALHLPLALSFSLYLLFRMPTCRGYTFSSDVYAINSLYIALGSPPLLRWEAFGGNPCDDYWQGVQCVNSSITAIVLNGANLGGQLSDELWYFTSVITLDLSNNHISGAIPESLPVTLRNFFLSANQLTGSIPGSLANLTLLSDISLNNNMLAGELPDAFQPLTGLINLDISHNNLSGQLPPSMESLSSLTTLHIQSNRVSGTLDVLQNLPLQDLNVESNLFSGSIPPKLLNVPNFKKNGNLFDDNAAPPIMAPPTISPFPQSPTSAMVPASSSKVPSESSDQFSGHSKISTIKMVGYTCMAVVLLVFVIAMVKLCTSKWKTREPKDAAICKRQDASRIGQLLEPLSNFIRSCKKRVLSKPIQRPEYNSDGQWNASLPLPPMSLYDKKNPLLQVKKVRETGLKL